MTFKEIQQLFIFSFVISCVFYFTTVMGNTFVDYEYLRTFYPWLTSQRYLLIKYSCEKHNVSIHDVCAIIKHESNGSSKAISVASARGLMQIMKVHYPGNEKDLHIDDINIPLGVKIYKDCLKQAKGDKRVALQYYNAGLYSNQKKYWSNPKNIAYVTGILTWSNRTNF